MDRQALIESCNELLKTVSSTGRSVDAFVRRARDSRRDLDGVSRELHSLKNVLKLIVGDFQSPTATDIQTSFLEQLSDILAACKKAVLEIDLEISKGAIANSKQKATWCMERRGIICTLLPTLKAHKSALDIALDMTFLIISREPKADIANNGDDSTLGKDNAEDILRQIADLQARLPIENRERSDKNILIHTFLEGITQYAETVSEETSSNATEWRGFYRASSLGRESIQRSPVADHLEPDTVEQQSASNLLTDTDAPEATAFALPQDANAPSHTISFEKSCRLCRDQCTCNGDQELGGTATGNKRDEDVTNFLQIPGQGQDDESVRALVFSEGLLSNHSDHSEGTQTTYYPSIDSLITTTESEATQPTTVAPFSPSSSAGSANRIAEGSISPPRPLKRKFGSLPLDRFGLSRLSQILPENRVKRRRTLTTSAQEIEDDADESFPDQSSMGLVEQPELGSNSLLSPPPDPPESSISASRAESAHILSMSIVDQEPSMDLDDSNYESEASLITFSLSSSVYDYTYENGRRYHAYHSGTYLLPNDETEQDRLEVLHHLFRLLLNGDLSFSNPTNPKTILDIGTGTGLWAMDAGDKYPESQILAVDLSPIQPDFMPPNVQFWIDNIGSLPWDFSDDQFDFIHVRCMGGSIRNWPSFLQACFTRLNPGGILEISEARMNIECDDSTYTEECDTAKWMTELHRIFNSHGIELDPFPRLPQLVADVGFEDVSVSERLAPIGAWAKGDNNIKQIGGFNRLHFNDAIDSYSNAPFLRLGGWEPSRLQELLESVKSEIKSRKMHLYTRFAFLKAQKPSSVI